MINFSFRSKKRNISDKTYIRKSKWLKIIFTNCPWVHFETFKAHWNSNWFNMIACNYQFTDQMADHSPSEVSAGDFFEIPRYYYFSQKSNLLIEYTVWYRTNQDYTMTLNELEKGDKKGNWRGCNTCTTVQNSGKMGNRI